MERKHFFTRLTEPKRLSAAILAHRVEARYRDPRETIWQYISHVHGLGMVFPIARTEANKWHFDRNVNK